jgi:hypothetical protein
MEPWIRRFGGGKEGETAVAAPCGEGQPRALTRIACVNNKAGEPSTVWRDAQPNRGDVLRPSIRTPGPGRQSGPRNIFCLGCCGRLCNSTEEGKDGGWLAGPIFTDAFKIVDGGVTGIAVWLPAVHPLFDKAIHSPASLIQRPSKLFSYNILKTTYQSHFIHIIFNNLYNHTNNT